MSTEEIALYDVYIYEDGSIHHRVDVDGRDVRGNFIIDEAKVEDLMRKTTERSLNTKSILKELGEELFNCLFSSTKLDHEEMSPISIFTIYFDRFKSKNLDNLKIRLRIDHPYAQSLPWEIMNDGSRFLSTDYQISIIRLPRVAPETNPVSFQDLKALIVVSAFNESGQNALEFASREMQDIGKLFTSKFNEPDILTTETGYEDKRPTLNKIEQMMRENQYNIVHFIGHSQFRDNNGEIQLCDDQGDPKFEKDETFAGIFSPRATKKLSLVVLNSCESGVEKGFNGLAKNLSMRRIPCVVAMQFRIYDKSSKMFSKEFYDNFLDGYAPERAIQAARSKFFNASPGPNSREFATPVLYLATRDETILRKATLAELSDKVKNKFRSNKIEPTNQFRTIPIHFDHLWSSSYLFSELESNLISRIINQKFLYWSYKAVRRWNAIRNSEAYCLYDWSYRVIKDNRNQILSTIADDSAGTDFDLVSFGPGTGEKDQFLLDSILKRGEQAPNQSISYYPIDQSICMIEETIKNILPLTARYRFGLVPIVGDFLEVNRFADAIGDNRNIPKIISLVGATIGNFEENEVFDKLKPFISEDDYLLIDAEFHLNRSENDLKSCYENLEGTQFIFGPLEDLGKAMPPPSAFSYEVFDEIFDVKGSRTLKGYVKLDGQEVQLFYSTKYDQAEFERYIERKGFKILKPFNYYLNISNSNSGPPSNIPYSLYALKRG